MVHCDFLSTVHFSHKVKTCIQEPAFSHSSLTKFLFNGCIKRMSGPRFLNRFFRVKHLMVNKLISSVEVNTSFMFQYIVLLHYSKVDCAVLMKTVQYVGT